MASDCVQVGWTPTGTFLRHFPVLESYRNGNWWGLSVNRDNTCLAVSCYSPQCVHTYSLPSGEPLAKLLLPGGGPGQFKDPMKIAFGPNGNLFVSEDDNARVQELTPELKPVRRIPIKTSASLRGIAVSREFIAVTVNGSGYQLFLHDLKSGALVRSFPKQGTSPGQLDCCVSARFSPNGALLAISEYALSRVSVFTVNGDFVTFIHVSKPRDAEFCTTGDLLIGCDKGILVYKPDVGGGTYSFAYSLDLGSSGVVSVEAMSYHPTSRRLYVLDHHLSNVCMFS